MGVDRRWERCVVVGRCLGMTFHGLVGCGVRDLIDVVKLTINFAYFTLSML